jgi:hypothetical protein
MNLQSVVRNLFAAERYPIWFLSAAATFSLMWVLDFTVAVRIESDFGTVIDCGSPSGVVDGDVPAGLSESERRACHDRASQISGLLMIPFGILFVASLVSGWRYYAVADRLRGKGETRPRSPSIEERLTPRKPLDVVLAVSAAGIVGLGEFLLVTTYGSYHRDQLASWAALGAAVTAVLVGTTVLYIRTRQ